MSILRRIDLKNVEKLKDFDRYEGSRRTEIKIYDREIEYRGFKIMRNSYIPVGAEGYWEVPKLKFLAIGGIKEGFLTVSITQSKEAIDKNFEMNNYLN
jgi:hypothetical protein